MVLVQQDFLASGRRNAFGTTSADSNKHVVAACISQLASNAITCVPSQHTQDENGEKEREKYRRTLGGSGNIMHD